MDQLPHDLGLLAFATTEVPGGVPLDPIGMAGCRAFVAPANFLGFSGSNGSAEVAVAIPTTITLLGMTFANQAIVFDSSAGNTAGAVVSDAARAIVGG